jgi:hypothetical protein
VLAAPQDLGESEHRIATLTNNFKTTHPSIRSRGICPH